ncbi:OsmC family peroxiredoxin [Ferrimicrobium acidiphilum]|uniref:Peroxiredoxin OsmC n=1 Tax=Ferrimicrobium acidiphilum DSM 19497 TaxID=1121877 RepID=A0A0D8FQ95_9ACTN|nr:OsmC family peroxiredoxin [Ferrimicrobium acidiphilum]KJE75460.1 peroxiredoxin OsmC [Ferrimicrobium acidiphilum DSM 19497]MCL5053744.1 OsmC family peroxiredoxin [Gammaproteobacteria bacterium]
MPIREAHTSWSGSLEQGVGTVVLTSSGIGSYEVSFPKRAAESAEGATSPEELIAAAHTSCYAMQFSALLGAAGGVDIHLEVGAKVHLEPDPDGGFHIPRIELTVDGSAQGVAQAEFHKIAEEAKRSCPVSKALSGTQIELIVV